MPPDVKPIAERRQEPGRRHCIPFLLRLTVEESTILHGVASRVGVSPQALLRMLVRNVEWLVESFVPDEADP